MTVTPEVVAAIMKSANPAYARDHNLNINHPKIRGCRLGVVFFDRNGDACVYTGVNGRNWKYPVMYTVVKSRKTMKATLDRFGKIYEASQGQ